MTLPRVTGTSLQEQKSNSIDELPVNNFAEQSLVQILKHQEADGVTIQENIIQGRYNIARHKMQQMCQKPIIDHKRAYELDKGDPNSLPTAIVQKQSALPILVGNHSRSKTGLDKSSIKLPNLNLGARESDSLLESR